MTMPIDLVLVRHGQSEQNLASRASKDNDHQYYTEEFRDRHVSLHRLTPEGRKQAVKAGKWLRDMYLGRFDARYVSTYTRAIETAMLLDLEGPDWYLDPLLREREWGILDGMSWEDRYHQMSQ